jgi:ubiquinone biosynthesis protein
MIRQLAPDHNYMDSFREQIARLRALHFAPARVKDKTGKLARDMERLVMDAPADTRRVLRRMAEGDLGSLPGLEALGGRFSRNLERLARAIAFAALVISGSLLLLTPMSGWHHTLGEVMIVGGIVGMVLSAIGAMRRGQRQR